MLNGGIWRWPSNILSAFRNQISRYEAEHEIPQTLEPMPTQEQRNPTVLVHGFLGFGSRYWGLAAKEYSHRILIPSIGPMSSLHDRATELFFNIKGGQVDYGIAHSETFGHGRFGKTYEGLYPEWSESKPVHVLAHSYGGPTARLLQQMLAEKAFPGFDTNENWILSITTVASPHRGTTGAYILGEKEFPEGEVEPLSLGSLLTKMVHVYEYLDVDFLKRHVFDLHLDHWKFSRKHATTKDLLSSLFLKSPVSDGLDNGAYDMTITAMSKLNKRIRNFSNCYYASYAFKHTKTLPWSEFHYPNLQFNPFLLFMSFLVGRKTFQNPDQIENDFKDSDWWANDGILNYISALHPGDCDPERCEHIEGMAYPTLKKGIWQVFEVDQCGHLDLVPLARSHEFQSEFYEKYFQYLDQIDDSTFNHL